MIKLGEVNLNIIPRVAIAITDKESNESIKNLHVDVLEVRVDQFQKLDISYIQGNVSRRAELGIPLILTVRNDPSEGGGGAEISDQEKMAIFQAIASFGDAVDIELTSPIVSDVVKLAKAQQKLVIISSHNLSGTPSDADLQNILAKAKARGADVVKIATKANSVDDVNVLLRFTLEHAGDNIITMSLGSVGAISRLTFPSAGSLLTYSYISKPFAEGQIPLADLQDDLRRYYPKYNEHFAEKSGVIENA